MANPPLRPAWSNQFESGELKDVITRGPLSHITPQWAWGDSTGKGVRVAVVDSGVEYDHPALGGSVRSGVAMEFDEQLESKVRILTEEQPQDIAGHGTACSGIIHSIAPEAEIYSVRVLGRDMHGKAVQFLAGLRWAINNNMQVINLSLSTSREEYYAAFHQLTDDAYFKNICLVSAVNNIPAPSYPSLYSSVISVAAHFEHDPFLYYYNPSPPVEFGASGIDVKVAWLNHQYIISTGNSFAASHIAGIVALILARHPELTPFQVKTVLYACAANTRKSK
jgi:subtilisin